MSVYALGPFRLDPQSGMLFRGSEPVGLGRRAVALLQALVERPGAVISKDALIEVAWPGQAIEDSNLTVQISTLRRVLGEAHGGDHWIETMPRRGYRFVGPVVATEDNVLAAPPRVEVQREAAPTEHSVTARTDFPRDAAPIEHGEAERRQLTALSCELVGVAAGAGGMDLEDLRAAVGEFQRFVSETADRHEGFLAEHLGNNALVLFGYPEAHEHDGERAIRAGLDLCAAVRALRPDARAPMRCRVGIATGLVIVGDPVGIGELRNQEIVGEAPNLAAWLLASAPPDTVAIDPATRRLIGNLFECRELGVIETAGGAHSQLASAG